MRTNATNLLPLARQRSLKRGYFLRLAVVVAGLFSAMVVIHGLLLTPSYLYLLQQKQTRQEQVAHLQSAEIGASEKEARERIRLLDEQTTKLEAESVLPTAAASLRTVLAAPRPGIILQGLSFVRAPSNTQGAKIQLTGIARDREALRTYLQVLDALPFVERTELPISAYAKEKELEFQITLISTSAS